MSVRIPFWRRLWPNISSGRGALQAVRRAPEGLGRGSASGEDGLWGRWQDYVQNGHGGNVVLMSREPSDYQVSVLEVAGTASTVDDIRGMEERWKTKLKTREMGLNPGAGLELASSPGVSSSLQQSGPNSVFLEGER